ncbi:hypothetical protein [Streptomyces virginiae]|uniref:hypothetical protein n=1 Tax=Streptomyces TaxID=1883 RepID=UPI0035D7C3DE
MKARSAILRTVAAALSAGALAWFAVTAGVAGSSEPQGLATRAVADDGPGYAIEDGAYPNADRILAERGIKLKRGDGHILLADCSSQAGLLEVYSRKDAKICFKVTGNNGYLSLEIPRVFGVKGNDYAAQVDMTTGTEEKTFTVDKNTWTPVGESLDEQGREFMLMEIRTSK